MKRKRKIVLVSLLVLGPAVGLPAVMSVEEAAKKGLVKMVLSSRGGHRGNVMQMKLNNLSGQKLDLKLEAGRRLDSQEQTEQDILITRSEQFALAPGEKKKLGICGMCCQAHNNSPDSGSAYSIGKMAEPRLVKLAEFIDQNKWHASSSAQDAIWVLSDDNPMESIYGDDAPAKTLREYVSKLSGKPLPVYSIKYEQPAEGSREAFTGRAAEISGVFEYDLTSNGAATFGVYDSENRLVKAFFAGRLQDPGHYTFRYSYQTSSLPAGKYYARLRVDGQLRKEMKFEF